MRGRKPKPTAIRKLEGNPGKRPLPENEPEYRLGARCPQWLSPAARREWRRLAPRLRMARVLTEVDRDMLAAYCEAVADLARAVELEARLGSYAMNENTGGYYTPPWMTLKRAATQAIQKLGSELGLSPASRPRIQARPPDDKPADRAGSIIGFPGARNTG